MKISATIQIPFSQQESERSLMKLVSPYEKPRLASSVWQIINTLVPYACLWILMYYSLRYSYWITLLLSVIAGGFLVRTFIIFHDCVHGSFFRSLKANRFWGFLTGILIFTAYAPWREEHNRHHMSSGNLDDRGFGCVWTLTVKEYLQASPLKKLAYRFIRNPLFLFTIIPPFLFMILHRFPSNTTTREVRREIHLTNTGIALMALVLMLIIGWKAYLLVQIPVIYVAATIGVWIFYVQHQFEGVYWQRQDKWGYVTAALKGSSFYKLPKILQWFSGNIGFHHIHHLSPRIPNYLLEKCYLENAVFREIKPITFWASFRSLSFRLWDEEHCRLVGFGYLDERTMAC
ncbi:MAG: fatty acid desaturase [Candidatus Omnitrophica bacterium]|nr:fatty acid desaturase [Candidatus Omnitrophota bacterium]